MDLDVMAWANSIKSLPQGCSLQKHQKSANSVCYPCMWILHMFLYYSEVLG